MFSFFYDVSPLEAAGATSSKATPSKSAKTAATSTPDQASKQATTTNFLSEDLKKSVRNLNDSLERDYKTKKYNINENENIDDFIPKILSFVNKYIVDGFSSNNLSYIWFLFSDLEKDDSTKNKLKKELAIVQKDPQQRIGPKYSNLGGTIEAVLDKIDKEKRSRRGF